MTQIILSSNQIHRLHHHFFVPTGDIRATLLIVHGMSEHSGRYAKFAQFLADNGILVATFDQLGHGQTVKDKYELGFFDDKHPVQTLCKDVIIMADKLKAKAQELRADVPHFIMGHSMGSLIVRTVLIHHSSRFAGAILMGTTDSFGLMSSASLSAFKLLNTLNPKKANHKFAALMNGYLLSQLASPISASPFAWLAERKSVIAAFEADPLCGFVFSNNGFVALHALLKKATTTQWYAAMAADFAILLVSGKDDPVGNLGQDVNALHHKLYKAGKAVSSHIYPNMRHEILHEHHAKQVYQDILHWLKKHS